MDILKKIGDFLTTAAPVDLVLLVVLLLVPILAIVILIVTAVKGAKRRRAEREQAAIEEPLVASQELPAATLTKETDRVVVYAPRPQTKAQTQTKICIKKLKKADKSLLAATAIFCIGLGVMIQRAVSGNK